MKKSLTKIERLKLALLKSASLDESGDEIGDVKFSEFIDAEPHRKEFTEKCMFQKSSEINIGEKGFSNIITFDELMNTNLTDIVAKLESIEKGTLSKVESEDYLRAVYGMIRQKPGRGLTLINEFSGVTSWEEQVWSQLFSGFVYQVELNPEQYRKLVEFISQNTEIHKIHRLISSFLYEGVEKVNGGFPDDIMDEVLQLSEKILERAKEEDTLSIFDSGPLDLFGKSINHSGGKLTQFWMKAMHKVLGEDARDIPQPFRGYFESAIDGDSFTENMALVIIGSRLSWLHYLDRDWTKEKLIPAFKWTESGKEPKKFQLAWEGYMWGKWYPPLLDDFMPLYKEAISHLGELNSQSREHFASHMAGIALFGSGKPWEEMSSWLGEYVRHTNEKERQHFAKFVCQILDDPKFPKDRKIEHWNKWIKEYWKARIDKFLPELTTSETNWMINWVFQLPESLFSEVVDFVLKSPMPDSWDHSKIRDLIEGEIPDKYSDKTADLIAFMLQSLTLQDYPNFKEMETLVHRLKKSKADHMKIRAICIEMSRLGYPDALKLLEGGVSYGKGNV